jgi:hypothetical protein
MTYKARNVYRKTAIIIQVYSNKCTLCALKRSSLSLVDQFHIFMGYSEGIRWMDIKQARWEEQRALAGK